MQKLELRTQKKKDVETEKKNGLISRSRGRNRLQATHASLPIRRRP
jgi:hypothetical protein